MADINREITAQVAGLSGSVTSLANVGITYTNQPATSTTPAVSNILTVNDGQLSSALASNFSAVQNLFGSNMVSNNANLAVFSETNSLSATSFILNINPGTSTFTATVGTNPPINLTATALAGGGYLLAGPAGSALDGLQLIYASNSNATINVSSITQGIASTLYNTSTGATTTTTGTIAVALSAIQTQNKSLNTDITRVNNQVAQYKKQLQQQYAALEGLLASTNNILASIAANEQAQLVQSQIG
jgi:flagellar hook-associated protein 2